VITFALWSIHASVRWAMNQPVAQRRGVLKWIFLGLLAVGLGILMASNSGKEQSPQPMPMMEGTSAVIPGEGASVRVTFTDIKLRLDGEQLLMALSYTREDHGGELQWETGGQFSDGPPKLQISYRTEEGASAPTTFTVTMPLPRELSRAADEAQRWASDRWQEKSIEIHPGDRHLILSILTPDESGVRLFLTGTLKAP
jgi:hypothetical protein